MPTVHASGRRALRELFEHCELSATALSVLAAQSPDHGMVPAQATVSMHAIFTEHYLRRAHYPVGGRSDARGDAGRGGRGVRRRVANSRTVTGIEVTQKRKNYPREWRRFRLRDSLAKLVLATAAAG